MADTAVPRILLFGRDGQLGRELARSLAPLGEVVTLGRTATGELPGADLAAADALRAAVHRYAPALIVNAAAYTNVERAEDEPDLAHAVNAEAPGVLAEAARAAGAALLHWSTDYVFDGRASNPYAETAAPNPLNVYGATKLAGERAIAAVGGTHLILRTSWVYAPHGRNFLRTLLRAARERDELTVVADQFGVPNSARQLADAAAAVLAAVRSRSGCADFAALADHAGLYHVSAAGATSWHGFACAIVAGHPDPARRAVRVRAIATADYPTRACRPAYAVLDGSRFGREFGVVLPDWQVGLTQCLAELGNR